MGETKIFAQSDVEDALAIKTIKEVADSLEEKGYNAINQIVGYLMSGDPGYISSYQEARTKIQKINRTKLLEVIVKEFIKWDF